MWRFYAHLRLAGWGKVAQGGIGVVKLDVPFSSFVLSF